MTVVDYSRRARRAEVLPASLPPRGLDRLQAAAYICVSATKFDQMVEDGRMPKPKQIDARVVWDVRKLDLAFDALPEQDAAESEGADAERWKKVAV
ncbi:hypothetical protein [Bosea sp. BK604]|uniref:hypothetical protein n=1 Tax=Bosea sp. BK604 TaxID=2512180 RepID=UPI00104322ED|nr:hypothetical protein [Bosea sp. BK604]TCR69725.1 hypothetical protein EV560_101122 [Bosea sp. BK604]